MYQEYCSTRYITKTELKSENSHFSYFTSNTRVSEGQNLIKEYNIKIYMVKYYVLQLKCIEQSKNYFV